MRKRSGLSQVHLAVIHHAQQAAIAGIAHRKHPGVGCVRAWRLQELIEPVRGADEVAGRAAAAAYPIPHGQHMRADARGKMGLPKQKIRIAGQ
ncbi:hypothetical protein GALL_496140 [mine drainage metagenome]|uniref:Uncharacterized protein n=1 Tax=mine drainage metagenome TaxID=410659 RepID=A0A1J5PYR9_9ZZZZ